ncbi:GPI biosynthesis protein Pig-F [Cordyceps fumosorosea ARSEF 2679]|uniref:GPI biosynthesis protein Pig-F n=1 Tax=Cordyceps fumosorosea (strain ARSEF 2679) TaxID=1081104 RepID=A0A168CFC6_CORFA|nr:GPI biosynthesis protein Pig-F [Cordyceps fumosorosea ARSEF 2679]OAA71307.1 GPI biosynthesis protein Pig-F [Cordyceps fumosorosea ARSEF 2679]
MASATPVAKQAGSQTAPSFQPSSPPNKRDLKSWWKGFILPSKNQDQPETRAPGIFGVPLRQSITYANVAISLIDEKGQSYIYGYVPIVVAKCGVFLKEKATGVEGIFRLSGSEKRIKELKSIFDSPDRYGKGLVWDGYTVHDAANVLRRYLNDLPEPVVPLDLYEQFRDPLRGATKQVAGDAEGPQFVPDFDEKAAIHTYQRLITELPPLNRQLLLYILDLLAVFAAKSEENRMTSQNLAAIFQPGMLSHPQHAMAPEEYRLNQCVIIFLIENQDHFLIGMQGTAADENTVKEVQSGTPKGPLTPSTVTPTQINRTASNASAGAESVRRDGKLRRNRSVSSKHSKKDDSATPAAVVVATSSPAGGLSRSNTVPSKKSPTVGGRKFAKVEKDASGPVQPLTPVRLAEAPMTSGPSTPLALPDSATKAPPGNTQDRHLENSADVPPTPKETKERSVSNLFQRTSTEGGDKRQPNKLRKKRAPGAIGLSAHSSSNSLPQSNAASPNVEMSNPLENVPPVPETIPTSAITERAEVALSPAAQLVQPVISTAETSSPTETKPIENALAELTDSPVDSANGHSDPDHTTDDRTAGLLQSPGKERKKRWLSLGTKKDDGNSEAPPQFNLGLNHNAETSTTSFASSSKARRSFQADGSEAAFAESYDSKDGEAKGPIGWIKNKYREAKENADHKRNKSPPPAGERQGISAAILGRGKSLDIKRDEPSGPKPTETALKKEEGPAAQHPIDTTVTPATNPSSEPPTHTAIEHQPVKTIKEEPATEASATIQPAQSTEVRAVEPIPSAHVVYPVKDELLSTETAPAPQPEPALEPEPTTVQQEPIEPKGSEPQHSGSQAANLEDAAPVAVEATPKAA